MDSPASKLQHRTHRGGCYSSPAFPAIIRDIINATTIYHLIRVIVPDNTELMLSNTESLLPSNTRPLTSMERNCRIVSRQSSSNSISCTRLPSSPCHEGERERREREPTVGEKATTDQHLKSYRHADGAMLWLRNR